MAAKTAMLSVRIEERLDDRLMDVVAATGGQTGKSEIVIQAIEQLLAQLEVCPQLIEGYNPKADKSARQLAEMSYKKGGM